MDDLGPDRHHLLEQRTGLSGAGLDHLAVFAVKQPQQLRAAAASSGGGSTQSASPCSRRAARINLSVVLQIEEFEHLAVLGAGIGLEVVEHSDVAAVAIDQAEEILQVLAEEAGFPIVEEARFEAAARDLPASAALRRQVPGAIELPLVLVAVVEQALVERGHQLERVADGNQELGARPQLQDRLEPLRRVEITDRAFRKKIAALPIGKKAVEIFVADDVPKLALAPSPRKSCARK